MCSRIGPMKAAILGEDLGDERRRRHLRRYDALAGDLDDIEQVAVVIFAILAVDSVADTSEQDQTQEGTSDGQQPHDLVLVSPTLASLIKYRQKDQASESDAAGVAVSIR
jgi:hypothetical protein